MDVFVKFIGWFIVTLVGSIIIIDTLPNVFISSFIVALIVAVLAIRGENGSS